MRYAIVVEPAAGTIRLTSQTFLVAWQRARRLLKSKLKFATRLLFTSKVCAKMESPCLRHQDELNTWKWLPENSDTAQTDFLRCSFGTLRPDCAFARSW